MASTELDPLFIRGLRLLHSKSKDSAEQLRLLHDEVLNQSKQAAAVKDKHFSPAKLEHESKLYLKKAGSREISDASGLGIKQQYEETRKAEKRPAEKLKLDDSELMHEAKIPKLDSPQVMSTMSYYPPSPDLPKLDHFVSKRGDDDTDCSDDNADAGDFAMEMGLACIICKQIHLAHTNQLVECQECHNLYHQECHKPAVTDYDVNDPRRVWYCAKCTKNMKKMATKTQKPTKPIPTATTKESNLQARFTKPETVPPSVVLPFKRTELKAPVTQGNHQSSANKPIGLAGLAANFSGRVTTASSSISSNASSRPVNSKPLINPMKPFTNLSTLGSSTAMKTIINTSSLSSPSKSVNTSFSSLSSSSISSTVIAKPSSSSSTTSSKTGIGLLSAAASVASSRTSSSSNNGGAKPATCSLLMSADKRVQIMKKRAAKMQEKRRLSSK